MSNSKFPNAAPRRMNGAHKLFAQAQALPTVEAARRATAAPVRPTGPDLEAVARGLVAMQQVANVRQTLALFTKQLQEHLPAEHDVRVAAERLIATLHEVLDKTEGK